MFLLAIATALCSPPEPQTAPVVTRIRVDGRLDDAAWAAAQELGPLRVFEPSGNAQDHEVRVLVTQDERGASLEHYGISPDFRAENGFLEEVGRLGVEGHASRFIRDQGVLRSVELAVDASGSYDFQGAWTGGRVGPRVEGLFGEKLYQQAEFAAIHERYQSRDFERWTFNGYSGITASPHLGISLFWDIGPEPHYDAETAADLYLGFSYLGGTQVSVSMLDRLSVSWDLTAAQFRRSAAGEVVYTTLINRVKTNLNISRPFSFRWIEEWNTFDSQLTSSILAAYQLHPGTAAYIGYSQTSDLAARDTTDRVLFAKVSWLWRV